MNKTKHICDFIKNNHLLTLCVNSHSDLWCANCYYIFDSNTMSLFIMTSEESYHSQLMMLNKNIAGTIAPQPKNIIDIKGIQFKGYIEKLTNKEEKRAKKNYYNIFPAAKLISAPIWEIKLTMIKMTDNSLGFGKKLTWPPEMT
ncbi:YhbP family protein [Photobacterium sp. S4TG1]|uniref:YhbP family protein n=1 Tax=Photobacterium sp. S4TG1 TaxID=3114587 RepID=UPI002E16FE96|nr:YhbP family protein [Photobacterium sp. S4TG1]